MPGLLSILHLEDNSADAELVGASLEAGGLDCELHVAESGDDYGRMIRSREYDLIISDSSVHAYSGMQALALAIKVAPKTPFIFVSGLTLDEETKDREAGASDHVSKSHLARLPTAVRRAVVEARSRRHLCGLVETSEVQAELLGSLAESVFAIDATGRIRFWTEAGSILFACGIKSPEGLNAAQADAVCGCEFFKTTFDRDLQPGESQELFCEFNSGPGKWIRTKHSKSIESGEFGHLDLYIAVDVSARKQLEARTDDLEFRFEQRVTDRTSELSFKNDELRSFSYTVSHDLRAPLHIILGYSQALVEEYGVVLGLEGLGYVKRIELAGMRINQLITGLLQLAMLDREQLSYDTVDMTTLARDIAADLMVVSGPADVRITVEAGLTVFADARLLRSLLENLLQNAVKYAPKGRQTSIDVGECTANGIPSYFVRDDGDGFSAADAEVIFEPFKRLSVGEGATGHGIGLATAKRIVEKHGGRISAESPPDQGATFYFSIPESLGSEADARGLVP